LINDPGPGVKNKVRQIDECSWQTAHPPQSGLEVFVIFTRKVWDAAKVAE
jgi:hypothetical protein